jgi:carbamoyl-phosphate synthase small subunit
MSNSQNKTIKKAYLLLEDGTYFIGKSYGVEGTAGGELCFNTGMTGYQEVFTDPSYTGQVLIMNTAYIGNYGVKKEDVESTSVKIRALITRNLSDRYSRMMADDSLQSYLLENQIVAISDIDTRALVTHVRAKGAMNCVVSTDINNREDLEQALKAIPSMEGLELSSSISTKDIYMVGDENAPYKIAVYDYGIKQSMLRLLSGMGAYLKVFPAKTPFEEVKNFNADGYFISNGPGDPAAMDYAVDNIKGILTTGKPLFGICLGNQLLAIANGAKTYKMHHGHRGLNHPVKNLETGLCEITTQNHGFCIDPKSLTDQTHLEVTHVNLNDGSIEGVKMTNYPAFAVQYHPESTPGPHDSRYLFNNFLALIEKSKA